MTIPTVCLIVRHPTNPHGKMEFLYPTLGVILMMMIGFGVYPGLIECSVSPAILINQDRNPDT